MKTFIVQTLEPTNLHEDGKRCCGVWSDPVEVQANNRREVLIANAAQGWRYRKTLRGKNSGTVRVRLAA